MADKKREMLLQAYLAASFLLTLFRATFLWGNETADCREHDFLSHVCRIAEADLESGPDPLYTKNRDPREAVRKASWKETDHEGGFEERACGRACCGNQRS
jgi:hypothetical protein